MEREISKPQQEVKSHARPEAGQLVSSSKIIYFGIFNIGHLIQENMRIAKEERNKNQQ